MSFLSAYRVSSNGGLNRNPRQGLGLNGIGGTEDNENRPPAPEDAGGRNCSQCAEWSAVRNLAGDRRDALGDRLLQLLRGKRHGEVVRSGGVCLLEFVDLLRLRGRHDDRQLGVGAT